MTLYVSTKNMKDNWQLNRIKAPTSSKNMIIHNSSTKTITIIITMVVNNKMKVIISTRIMCVVADLLPPIQINTKNKNLSLMTASTSMNTTVNLLPSLKSTNKPLSPMTAST